MKMVGFVWSVQKFARNHTTIWQVGNPEVIKMLKPCRMPVRRYSEGSLTVASDPVEGRNAPRA